MFDKVIVWENGTANGKGTSNTTQFLQNMARSMPPMMQIMKDIGGVELPEFIARLVPESRAGDRATPPRGGVNGPEPTTAAPPQN